MTTKERILHTALELFNESGPETVTVRHIAAAMGISHGNLCYHYPNTDTIVRALYDALVKELDSVVETSQTESAALFEQPENVLAMVLKQSRRGFEIMYRYRFVLLHFHSIMRNDEYILKHFRELTDRRTQQFRMMVDFLMHSGLVRKEHFPGEFDYLIELQLLAGDGWVARAELVRKMGKTEAINYFTDVVLAPWIAVMTERGIKWYLEAKKK
ncbi:MAG: TetR/AcrR family transcriptional regulator [Bacteroidia bacterium]|nr:TetR/AcrR family transcriptional regulator [Bacteroidia bacterium]